MFTRTGTLVHTYTGRYTDRSYRQNLRSTLAHLPKKRIGHLLNNDFTAHVQEIYTDKLMLK